MGNVYRYIISGYFIVGVLLLMIRDYMTHVLGVLKYLWENYTFIYIFYLIIVTILFFAKLRNNTSPNITYLYH